MRMIQFLGLGDAFLTQQTNDKSLVFGDGRRLDQGGQHQPELGCGPTLCKQYCSLKELLKFVQAHD